MVIALVVYLVVQRDSYLAAMKDAWKVYWMDDKLVVD
jgi:hypothetical protein